MEDRINQGWYQTFTGLKFNPLAPEDHPFDIRDIAHGLSLECRYGGQCRWHYSVAQHSVMVARHLPHHLMIIGLMHDASEAYIKDLPYPLKAALPDYRAIEAKVVACICKRFGLPEELPPEVKEADKIALATERRFLINNPHGHTWKSTENVKTWDDEVITPMRQETAEELFVHSAWILGIK